MVYELMKDLPCARACYICRHSGTSTTGRGLHFHCIPRKPRSRPILDKWLEFLLLPPSNLWPNTLYHKITLCSLHFNESDYPLGYRGQLRVMLLDGAVPSLNPPDGPGVLGALFSSQFKNWFGRLAVSPKNGSSNKLARAEITERIGSENQYADPATMDHDYVCTTSGTSPTQEFSEMTEEETSSQFVFDDLRKELCRLCGQKKYHLTPVFETLRSDTTPGMPLNAKIEMYLPFKIKIDDPLPSQICSNCHDALNQWHELYVTCVAANTVLWRTLGRESDKSSQNCLDSINARVQEGSDTETIKDQRRKCNDLCAECGKNKIEAMRDEEMFKKELEKCPVTIRSVTYKCYYCHEFFKNPLDRKSHIAMCRELSTICELCGLKVSCRKDLRRHRYHKHNKINLQRRFTCSTCDKSFRNSIHLSHHVKTVHEKDKTPKYHCELCCRTFVGEHHYQTHFRKHEKGKIKSLFQIEALTGDQNVDAPAVYSCPVCQEIFNDTFSLVVHLTSKKKIKCSVCPKVSTTEKRFLLHTCGLWTCEYCFKTFDKRAEWIAHERIHTGEKPIKCRFCNERFSSWKYRNRHEISHKPTLQCSYCGKSFRNKYVFQDHIERHEGKIFPCQICKKHFGGRKSLGKHVRSVHKISAISEEHNVKCVS